MPTEPYGVGEEGRREGGAKMERPVVGECVVTWRVGEPRGL